VDRSHKSSPEGTLLGWFGWSPASLTAPDRTLYQIAAQLEALREGPTRHEAVRPRRDSPLPRTCNADLAPLLVRIKHEAMKVVALTSDKGGMGKSTAAINLACAAAGSGLEAAILDLDPQASVGRWARVRKKAGLAPRPFAEVCVPIDVEDRLAELKEAGAQLVLLDTAGRDNNAITSAIAAADLVLIPCHPTDLELSTLGPTLARLRADQKSHHVLF
jgi:CobQ/CobB/MinD/ParA nucleotide binding domain